MILGGTFSEKLLVSLPFPDILINFNYNFIVSLDRYGVAGCLEQKPAALHNDYIEQNDIEKGKMLQQSHSTECVIECGESRRSEMQQ